MKKVIVASSILLSLFLSACSTNFGSIGSNSLSTDNDLSNTSEVNHDSDDNQQHKDEEDFLIYCLPQEFYYQDIQYEMKTGVRLDDSDIADFLGYFINLKAAMEVSRYSTNKEVVMMRFRYRFGSEFDWGTNYYIDFHPVYRISDTNLYNSNYIGYISDESPINGTVHGFKNASEISSYLR